MAIYVALSGAITVLARPGYDAISGIVILLGGSLGSLKLSIESARDIQYETLDAGLQFNSEALTVSLVSITIWLVGAGMAFMASRSNWRGGFLAGLIGIWIVGSGYNIVWFGLRSL
jgi:hypothetical protein